MERRVLSLKAKEANVLDSSVGFHDAPAKKGLTEQQ